MAKKKHYDLDSERNFLRSVLSNEKFCINVMTYGLIAKEHFADLFHRDSWKAIVKYFNKFGAPPSEKHLNNYIEKTITYSKKYKSQSKQLKIWKSALAKLFVESKYSSKKMRAEIEYLDELRKKRLIQKSLVKMTNDFEKGRVKDIAQLMSRTLTGFKVHENVVTQGNITEDLGQHLKLDKMIKAGHFRPIPTGIIGVMETKSGGFKIIYLDDLLDGGVYPGEMTMFVGEVNIGKSFVLMEIPYNVSRVSKKNTILMTIEMNKIKSQRRIYTRATGIPYSKFKRGELTKKDIKKLNDWKDDWEENCGILEVVAFDKGASPVDIANKVDEVENKYGKEFELVSIDYLQDLSPSDVSKKGDKDWTAIGGISWELAQFSKYHDNGRGIALIDASQKKTKQYGKADTKIGSSMGSALPEHHATVGIGVGQNSDDEIIGRIRFDMFKNRDGGKGRSFYTFTDYAKSRISSIKKLKKYYTHIKDETDNEKN